MARHRKLKAFTSHADKSLILHCKGTREKSPPLNIGQEDLSGLLQAKLSHFSLPRSPVSSPLSGHVTAQQQNGRSAPARLFPGKLGEATQAAGPQEKSTCASKESSAGSRAGSPAAPRASAGSSAELPLCRRRALRLGSLLLRRLGFGEEFRCWRAEPGK